MLRVDRGGTRHGPVLARGGLAREPVATRTAAAPMASAAATPRMPRLVWCRANSSTATTTVAIAAAATSARATLGRAGAGDRRAIPSIACRCACSASTWSRSVDQPAQQLDRPVGVSQLRLTAWRFTRFAAGGRRGLTRLGETRHLLVEPADRAFDPGEFGPLLAEGIEPEGVGRAFGVEPADLGGELRQARRRLVGRAEGGEPRLGFVDPVPVRPAGPQPVELVVPAAQLLELLAGGLGGGAEPAVLGLGGGVALGCAAGRA